MEAYVNVMQEHFTLHYYKTARNTMAAIFFSSQTVLLLMYVTFPVRKLMLRYENC